MLNVSRWDINFLSKFRGVISENDDGVIIPSQNDNLGLKYVHAYASRKLRLVLGDNINADFSEKTSLTHSPILGWAYDGSPIYGPYGFSTPTGGAVRRMVSGYTQVSKGNRPPVGVFPQEHLLMISSTLLMVILMNLMVDSVKHLNSPMVYMHISAPFRGPLIVVHHLL